MALYAYRPRDNQRTPFLRAPPPLEMADRGSLAPLRGLPELGDARAGSLQFSIQGLSVSFLHCDRGPFAGHATALDQVGVGCGAVSRRDFLACLG